MNAFTMLLTISGRDKPGVSAQVFEKLGDCDLTIIEVEQTVINSRLFLGIHISGYSDQAAPMIDDLTQKMHAIDMSVDIDFIENIDSSAPVVTNTHAIIVLGQPVPTGAIAAITRVLASNSININSITSVAQYPLTGLELRVALNEKSDAYEAHIRRELAEITRTYLVDIAIDRSSLAARTKRLIVFDVDSTLIQGEVIEMLAVYVHKEAEIARITEAAMRGEYDFTQSLVERVSLLSGLPESVLNDISEKIVLMPGAKTTIHSLQQLGYRVGLVSGGFHQVIDPIAQRLGVDFVRANTLEIIDGHLTGAVLGNIIDRKAKAEALIEFAQQYKIPVSQTVAVGDGANDIDMITTAGLGIAFCAKAALEEIADASLHYPYLDAVLFLLGITRSEIEELCRDK